MKDNSQPEPSPELRFGAAVHKAAVDAVGRQLLQYSTETAVSGLQICYVRSEEAELPNESGPPRVVRGIICVVAGDYPESDMKAIEDFLAGYMQDVTVGKKLL